MGSEDMSATGSGTVVFLVLLLLAARAGAASLSPTFGQKARLDEFGYDVFQSSLPGLVDQSGKVTQAMLVRRFGHPLRRAFVFGRSRYGQPAGTMIRWTTWYFRGLALAMSRLPAGRSHAHRTDLVVVGVSVTSPAYVLRDGLRVGERRSRFIRVLGPPTFQDRRHVRYDVENAARVGPGEYAVQSYQIRMDLDGRDRVRRIVWSWWSG